MNRPSSELLRFITRNDVQVEEVPWGPHHWMSRPGLTEAENLLLVRVHMLPGKAHQFHTHPTMEEIIYILSGQAEQWVDEEHRVLHPGEIAHIPEGIVHGTYNPFDEPLVFLAILGPANAEGPALVDVCREEPWCTFKEPVAYS